MRLTLGHGFCILCAKFGTNIKMASKLLIVESPAKAKTIGEYLGGDFLVKSSVGHIRDLPKDDGSIAISKTEDGNWTFTPKYEIGEGKDKVVADLKAAVKKCSEIYLASDPDREGEAIAWHLKEVLKGVAGDKPFHRVTYNEITKSAVTKAIAAPREIDMPLVDAQQARRILDRIVGYRVSPLLWKYIQCANNRSLSAGRVQSVALRLLVERQKEIDSFKPETYFVLGVEAKKRYARELFVAKLSRFDGEKPSIGGRQTADNMLLDLSGAKLEVVDIKATPKKRHAPPPFTTSTMQQAASSFLSISPGKTMSIAQELYEKGLITYMRTDSVNISEDARGAAKAFITANYGAKYYPEKPNFYKSKETSQGAHEAIRPTNVALTPAAAQLEGGAAKLYALVWNRFMASQMADARTTVRTVALAPRKPGLSHEYVFSASTTDIDFDGFLVLRDAPKTGKAKTKKDDGPEDEDSDEVAALPPLEKGEIIDANRWIADEKQTKGPAYYSEASLVKALEENGVGRPSTYAATIETLKNREYAKNEKRKLVPLERGMLVCDWLVKKLDSLFSVGYTAKMEAELDKVEEAKESMNAMLSDFYKKFLVALESCREPAPDRKKFELVFELLSGVTEWRPAKIEGRRKYDDKAFVESVKDQMEEGRPLSAKQLDFLIRMVSSYASQIPDAEKRLKEAGLGAGASLVPQKADDGLVQYAFGVMKRIPGMLKNPFLKSLSDQYERGRGLSMKQFKILAKAVGENAAMLEDCGEIRAKLSEFVPDGFSGSETDPAVPGLLKLVMSVTEWRPVQKKGKKVYDDKAFVYSLSEQFAMRHSLSNRQAMALRRLAVVYKDKIPEYSKYAESLGITKLPSARNGEKTEGDDTP